MTIRNYITKILISLVVFPSILFANNFPHISTWGYDLLDLSLDLNQAKWVAVRQDWIFGGGGNAGYVKEITYDTMKSVNPNIKFVPYIAYNTYEVDPQNWIKDWCARNGYNFEDTFYHYYYDTTAKLRGSNPSQILIKGYGGGTAKTIQESRVPSSWAQYSNGGLNQTTGQVIRLNTNPTSKVWRLGYQAYILEKRIKINASKGKYADGIELDTFEGTVYDAYDLQLERTIEMRNLGKFTRAEANVQGSNDLIAAMKELKTYLTNQTGKPIITVPNTGDVDAFYQWRKFLYADKVSDYTHVIVEYMTLAGSSNYRIPRLKQVYDTMENDGLVFFARNATGILNVSERVNQFLIASHYLINHPNYILMYHRGSPANYGGVSGQIYTTHWHKNLEYDIGVPVKRSTPDYWGAIDTDRFFIFASDPNYTIVGREYSNALVLAKFGAKGGVANAGNNPTTHDLDGAYRLLQPNNSLGPLITEITLGDSEGAILIKEQQTVLPTVTIVASDNTATEAGPTTGTFTVSRTGSTAASLTVYYSVGGTSTGGSDRNALPGSLTIPAGSSSAPIIITPINDTLVESDETVVLTLSANAAYTVGTPSSATITIIDDDKPRVTIAATDNTATEAGLTTGTFTVSRTGSTAASLTVYYSVGGTSTGGSDYNALPGSLTIPAGFSNVLILITPINDTLAESDETVVLTLSANAAYTVGTPASAVITIIDNDKPTVSIVAADNTATEAGPTTGTFMVTRTGSTAASLTVYYTVGGTSGGSDRNALPGSLTIPAGSSNAPIIITPINDTLAESDETVVLTLSAYAAYTVGTPSSATITIIDDDQVPPGHSK